MQYRIDYDFASHDGVVESVVMYHNPSDPMDDNLYISLYTWTMHDDGSGTLNLLLPNRNSSQGEIDGVDVLFNNKIFAQPFFDARDVTTASSLPSTIDNRPVHNYNLVHFNLASILEVLKYAATIIPDNVARTARAQGTETMESHGVENVIEPEKEKTLYFTDTPVRFPSLRATVPYSPLDYFKTLEVNHQKTDDTDVSHRENLAANVGIPCPPRWNNGIALIEAMRTNNLSMIEKFFVKNKLEINGKTITFIKNNKFKFPEKPAREKPARKKKDNNDTA